RSKQQPKPDPSAEPTPADVEAYFWRVVETQALEVRVDYGNDIDSEEFGSGFPALSDRERAVLSGAIDAGTLDGLSRRVTGRLERKEMEAEASSVNNVKAEQGTNAVNSEDAEMTDPPGSGSGSGSAGANGTSTGSQRPLSVYEQCVGWNLGVMPHLRGSVLHN